MAVWRMDQGGPWKRHLAACILLLGSGPAMAKEAGPEGDAERYTPLAGTYDLVGRYPDSRQTYSGVISLSPAKTGLAVRRTVGGHTVSGIARIETRTADKIEILVLEFPQGKGKVEMWCRWNFDLDNYARLTCLWRKAGTEPKQPGLEAMFARQ